MMDNAKKGRRNRRRQVKEADIDFDGIVEELGRVKPKTIMVSEALERLIEGLSKGRERGVMVEQIVEICQRRGLDVDEEEVREVLERVSEDGEGVSG